ncbi:MAG: enoyl-CoA hydratase/isomerase family protein [Rhodospirillales bacterium]|nr:enoyl-CoA hydratase/isomerase family protein [Rhodospirillales bacterium]
MTDTPCIRHHIKANGIAEVTMSRPDIHNAFDDRLIADMIAAFEALAASQEVRVVVVAGEGKSFSAGADLNWMRRMADYSQADNIADARNLAKLLALIAGFPRPVIARVQGAAFGGGVGLVSACDMAIGADNALFALSEVKLGLIPAVISPFVIRAIGERQASRFMITGERFDAKEACRIGLLHQVVGEHELDSAIDRMATGLLKNGPDAMRECKALIAAVMNRPIDDAVMDDTSARIARVRASAEGREGLEAFLEKRPPSWLGRTGSD